MTSHNPACAFDLFFQFIVAIVINKDIFENSINFFIFFLDGDWETCWGPSLRAQIIPYHIFQPRRFYFYSTIGSSVLRRQLQVQGKRWSSPRLSG